MKIRFELQPDISPYLGDKQEINRCMLNKDWHFWIDDEIYWIPAGYDFNGASIPRLTWWIVGSPFEPQLQAPALVHDWLYLTHLTSRCTADECIYQLMIQNHVSSWRAHAIWAAVRSCGSLCGWPNNKNDKADLYKLTQEVAKRPDHAKFRLS